MATRTNLITGFIHFVIAFGYIFTKFQFHINVEAKIEKGCIKSVKVSTNISDNPCTCFCFIILATCSVSNTYSAIIMFSSIDPFTYSYFSTLYKKLFQETVKIVS